MENEELILEMPEDIGMETINTDELISDYDFLYKIRQMNLKLDFEDENYGFCL